MNRGSKIEKRVMQNSPAKGSDAGKCGLNLTDFINPYPHS